MAVTTEQVAELYVANFDRAPDADGLAYWVDSGLTIEEISASFFDQEESKAAYPDTMTDAEFVNEIYKNMFNHDADPDGLVYWEEELSSGNITRANMILAVANGALDTDQEILDNKTEVGLYFAEAGLNDVEQATAIMEDIDETETSVNLAKGVVDDVSKLVFTANRDNLVGTASDDTFSGDNTTIAGSDIADGLDGNDTLKVTSAAATVGSPSLTNIENVVFTLTGDATLEADGWSGVENLTINADGNAPTIDKIVEEIETFTIAGVSAGKTLTLDTATSSTAWSGSSDTLDLTLTSSSSILSLVTSADGTAKSLFENLDLTTSGLTGAAALDITASDSAMKVISIAGDTNIVITADSTSVTSVNASALSAGITYERQGTEEIIGGSGTDTITDNNDASGTITTGAGGDVITSGDGTDTIDGGAGDDTINAAGGNDTVTGGAGKDTITLGSESDTLLINPSLDTGLTTATSDVVTDFATTSDKIDFIGLDAASSSNLVSITDATVTSVEEAVTAANAGQLTGKTYVFYTDGTDGWLTFDSNNDGSADGAISLTAVTTLATADII